MRLSLILFLTVVNASIPWYNQEQPVLKVNHKSHDRAIIFQKLHQAFENMYKIPSNNHAKLYLGDKDTETKCIKDTEIVYFLKLFDFKEKEYEASECRININSQYKVLLSPTENFNQFLHYNDDPTSKQLESNILQRINRYKIAKLSSLDFYNFNSLDYSLECLIGYQEIGQVKMKELNLEAKLQQIIQVPESCGFQKFDKDFEGEFADVISVEIPINGTFYCKYGRSNSCKKGTAEIDHPRYRLFNEP